MNADTLSLGWQTDLMFARFDGHVDDRGDHLLVRTPANPGYWWGNFLLFGVAPQAGDLGRWMALFEREVIALQPGSTHRAFGVDGPEAFALPGEFAAAGFGLDEAAVLTLTETRLRTPRRPLGPGAVFGALDLPRDAPAVVDKQMVVDTGRHEPVSHRLFAERQMTRAAALQAAGLGGWFGVWVQDGGVRTLAASCGLFRDPARAEGLGRFQYVTTHPAWRRRGLCTALVHAVCHHGFTGLGLRTLVMVADPCDVAIGIYESLGFARGASTWQIARPPA